MVRVKVRFLLVEALVFSISDVEATGLPRPSAYYRPPNTKLLGCRAYPSTITNAASLILDAALMLSDGIPARAYVVHVHEIAGRVESSFTAGFEAERILRRKPSSSEQRELHRNEAVVFIFKPAAFLTLRQLLPLLVKGKVNLTKFCTLHECEGGPHRISMMPLVAQFFNRVARQDIGTVVSIYDRFETRNSPESTGGSAWKSPEYFIANVCPMRFDRLYGRACEITRRWSGPSDREAYF